MIHWPKSRISQTCFQYFELYWPLLTPQHGVFSKNVTFCCWIILTKVLWVVKLYPPNWELGDVMSPPQLEGGLSYTSYKFRRSCGVNLLNNQLTIKKRRKRCTNAAITFRFVERKKWRKCKIVSYQTVLLNKKHSSRNDCICPVLNQVCMVFSFALFPPHGKAVLLSWSLSEGKLWWRRS